MHAQAGGVYKLFQQTPMLKRTYSEINIDKFNSMLTGTNFQDVLDMNDPELAYSLFMDTYKYCFSECFPEKLTKLKMNKKYVKKGTVDDGRLNEHVKRKIKALLQNK